MQRSLDVCPSIIISLMGQNTSKEPLFCTSPPVFDEDISIRRRRRMHRKHSNRISVSGLESGSNIDSVLSKMGVQAEFEETPFSGIVLLKW